MYVPLPHLTAKDAACTTSPLSAPGNAGGFLLPGGPTCPPTRPCPASPPTWTASPPPSAALPPRRPERIRPRSPHRPLPSRPARQARPAGTRRLRTQLVHGRHPAGRATWEYGPEHCPGEQHIVWRRVGGHDILNQP
ncbi:hypothetical protein ACFQ3Z_45280 [Streptomyces nogalater]